MHELNSWIPVRKTGLQVEIIGPRKVSLHNIWDWFIASVNISYPGLCMFFCVKSNNIVHKYSTFRHFFGTPFRRVFGPEEKCFLLSNMFMQIEWTHVILPSLFLHAYNALPKKAFRKLPEPRITSLLKFLSDCLCGWSIDYFNVWHLQK